ncbi:MAG: hypothetical protein MUO77_03290 [Anaerolineales bacterium]|nr:hypothetical protein [Anaerolineales bacterium]
MYANDKFIWTGGGLAGGLAGTAGGLASAGAQLVNNIKNRHIIFFIFTCFLHKPVIIDFIIQYILSAMTWAESDRQTASRQRKPLAPAD